MNKFKKIGIIALITVVSITSVAFTKSDFFEIAKQIEIYTTLFKELNMYYIDETNPAELTEAAIDNMLKDLDPYTKFYDEQGVENARIDAEGEYAGIGAVSKYINGKLIIVETYEGSPADKAGIKPGDIIEKVNEIKVTAEKNDVAAELLKGAPGTTVKLELSRQGKKINKQLEREKVIVNPVPYFGMIDDEVGYISFIRFNQKSAPEVKAAYLDLKEKGMTKLIIDVRGNPGGLVNQAIEIVNFFVPKNEVVVTTKAKVKKWSDTYKTKRDPLDLEIPLVILIDGKSASASEILSGSLQDLDRAVIMGERSFGKGLVQRYRKLTYGTQLKLTISKYYTPSGRSIQELDYSQRDKNGEVPKFSDKKRNSFKTKNGRTVYDGGGIQPDIKFEKTEKTEATKALLNSSVIFDYATNFESKNPSITDAKSYNFTDADFDRFIAYIKSNDVQFNTRTEDAFKSAFEQSEKEDLSKDLTQYYQNIQQKIKTKKIADLAVNKDEIKQEIKNEIIKRYYYKKGEYINKVNNDIAVTKAVDLLKDTNKYNNILK